MLTNAMQGGLSVCFMFGQTGTGKSYTMSAIQETVAARMFDKVTCSDLDSVDVNLSCYEVQGNAAIRDLLEPRTCDHVLMPLKCLPLMVARYM
jgi:DNA repair ATPase RecN